MPRVIIYQILALPLLIMVTFFWWNAWMYDGVLGPLPILHWFISSDGEGSYDLTFYEMFVHLLAVYTVLFCMRHIRKNPVKGHSNEED